MHLGIRLRELRQSKGMTQRALAGSRYTAAYVSTVEAGKRHPSREAVKHFAHVLSVDPDWLSTGNDPADRGRLLGIFVEARRLLASGQVADAVTAHGMLKKLGREAQNLKLGEIQAKAVFGMGLAAEMKGDYDEALQRFAEAERLLTSESPLSRVDVTAAKARVLQTRGDVAHAAFLIEKLLAELRELALEDPSSLVRLHSSLVAAYFDAGLITKANASCEIALQLAPLVDDPERLGNMHLNVAIALLNQKRWNEAEKHFSQAERWFEEAHFRTDLAKVETARGMSFRDQQKWDEARAHLERALEIFHEAEQPLNEARTACNLAISERLAGRTDEARFLLRRCLVLSEEDRALTGMAHRELGLCDAKRDRAAAITSVRHALELLDGAGDAKELAITYRELGNLLSEQEDLREACNAYRSAANLFENAA